MKYLDLHCDTASELLYQNKELKNNDLNIDIKKINKGGGMAQVFAFFVDAGNVNDLYLEFQVMHKNFMNEIKKNSNKIVLVRNVNELNEANEQGKIGAFLSIEEGDVIEGDIDKLKKVYNMGIRIITLTWNYKNKIGYPNYEYLYKDKGLTSFGKEMVIEMESLGIIPDVSHLSDKGFYDLIDICNKPIIASHSNSRTITNHPRNLSDDMIKALANKGGIMGINYCADFLGKGSISSVADMIHHIKHIKKIGGIDVIALGSDYDGILNKVEMKDPSEMYKLENALKCEKFSDEDIEKIFYKNALRVFRECLK